MIRAGVRCGRPRARSSSSDRERATSTGWAQEGRRVEAAQDGQHDPLVAVAPGGVTVAGADRVAVPGLTVDLAAGVALDRVVAYQCDRPIVGHEPQDEPAKIAGRPHGRPRGRAEDAPRGRDMPGGHRRRAPQQAVYGAPAGGQDRDVHQQGKAPEVGRVKAEASDWDNDRASGGGAWRACPRSVAVGSRFNSPCDRRGGPAASESVELSCGEHIGITGSVRFASRIPNVGIHRDAPGGVVFDVNRGYRGRKASTIKDDSCDGGRGNRAIDRTLISRATEAAGRNLVPLGT